MAGVCDSRQPTDGADSGIPEDEALHCDLCTKVEWNGDVPIDWNGETGNHLSCEREAGLWHPDLHTCTEEICGHDCHWEGGEPLYSFHVSGAPDSGGFDADDQPYPCEDHLA
jgi:hypothetical protein